MRMIMKTMYLITLLSFFVVAHTYAKRQKVYGDAQRGGKRATTCFACHGKDGMGGRNGAWPVLAGQKEEYLAIQMRKFQKKERNDPSMSAFAAGLSEQDILDLSAFFSQLPYNKEGLYKRKKRNKK